MFFFFIITKELLVDCAMGSHLTKAYNAAEGGTGMGKRLVKLSVLYFGAFRGRIKITNHCNFLC